MKSEYAGCEMLRIVRVVAKCLFLWAKVVPDYLKEPQWIQNLDSYFSMKVMHMYVAFFAP